MLKDVSKKTVSIMKREVKQLETVGDGIYLQLVENGNVIAEFRGYCLDGSDKDELKRYEEFINKQ